MKKTVAIIPIKSKSERIPGKNLKKINGVPFYQFLLKKLKKCNFDEVYIDTDSKQIKEFAKKNNFHVINRLKRLSTKNANGNDLLNYHFKLIKADYYFQLFVTSPLLSVKSINKCIRKLMTNKKIDSIFTTKSVYTWFWFKKKPVNYNPKVLPRSQDAIPVIYETTGLYGIKKEALKKYKSRIGNNPFFFEVDDHEALDIDNKKDLSYFKYILRKNLK
jgi:CMP-N-acetylneuraminic acid synthetase